VETIKTILIFVLQQRDTDQNCKPHLISCDVCCLPKKDGGLMIKSPHQMNDDLPYENSL
jgi:hypothetical protein